MRALPILAFVSVLSSTAAFGSGSPAFHEGQSYNTVRTALLHAGWKPMNLVPAGHCGWDADACPKVPEVIRCAGAGALVPCFYAWRKGNEYLEIEAGGEGEPQSYIGKMRCKKFTRGDPRDLNDWKCVK